jgi:hypothetical protein
MSEMEPDVRNFLLKIITSISVALLWLLINSSIGIGLNYAFFDSRPSVGNYIFYGWFLLSFAALIFYLFRKWRL